VNATVDLHSSDVPSTETINSTWNLCHSRLLWRWA